MNGEQDYFARWVHAICAVPLLLFAAFEFYLLINRSFFTNRLLYRGGLGASSIYLCYRLIR